MQYVRSAGTSKVASAPSRYYLTIGTPKANSKSDQRSTIAVVAKELGGRIIDYCVYHRR